MNNRYLTESVYGLNKWASVFMNAEEHDKEKANRMIDEIPSIIEMTIEERTIRSVKPEIGDMYYCNFGTKVGSEIEKNRPVIVLQSTNYNKKLPTTLVMPITNKMASFPTEFNITSDIIEYFVGETKVEGCCTALHVNAVSIARLGNKIGKVNEKGIEKAFEALNEVLGTSPEILVKTLMSLGKDVALDAFINILGITREKLDTFLEVMDSDVDKLSNALFIAFGINKRMLISTIEGFDENGFNKVKPSDVA